MSQSLPSQNAYRVSNHLTTYTRDEFHLAELALLRMGARPFHVVVPTPRNREVVPVRSTGASIAIQKLGPVVSALQQAGFVVDCPSSDDLRPIRYFENGGSGSSGVRV